MEGIVEVMPAQELGSCGYLKCQPKKSGPFLERPGQVNDQSRGLENDGSGVGIGEGSGIGVWV